MKDNSIPSKDEAPPTSPSLNIGDYFTSDAAFYIFVLVHLDGRNRANLLGITPELYESRKKSKNWRNKIVKNIYPDHCAHPEAGEATAKLNELYSEMKENGEE